MIPPDVTEGCKLANNLFCSDSNHPAFSLLPHTSYFLKMKKKGIRLYLLNRFFTLVAKNINILFMKKGQSYDSEAVEVTKFNAEGKMTEHWTFVSYSEMAKMTGETK